MEWGVYVEECSEYADGERECDEGGDKPGHVCAQSDSVDNVKNQMKGKGDK